VISSRLSQTMGCEFAQGGGNPATGIDQKCQGLGSCRGKVLLSMKSFVIHVDPYAYSCPGVCVFQRTGAMSDAASQTNVLNSLKAICRCVQVSLLKQNLLKLGRINQI
jgi:hypothetical protein